MVKKLKNNTKKAIISTVERTSNVATITTSSDHGYTVNDSAHVYAQDSAYDVAHAVILSVPTSTTFTYANTGGDETAKADTGSIGKTKYIKGWQVYPDAYYTIPDEDEEQWRDDPAVEADLSGDQELLFNNGTVDVTDAAEGLAGFNANDATCILGVRVDDASKGDGKGLIYNDTSKRLEYSQAVGKELNVSFESANSPYKESAATSYESVSCFIFSGTTSFGSPTVADAIVELGGGTSMDIRVYDLTNGNTICELTGITDTPAAIKDLGTLSNMPAAKAIFEVQLKGDGPGRKARVFALSMR